MVGGGTAAHVMLEDVVEMVVLNNDGANAVSLTTTSYSVDVWSNNGKKSISTIGTSSCSNPYVASVQTSHVSEHDVPGSLIVQSVSTVLPPCHVFPPRSNVSSSEMTTPSSEYMSSSNVILFVPSDSAANTRSVYRIVGDVLGDTDGDAVGDADGLVVGEQDTLLTTTSLLVELIIRFITVSFQSALHVVALKRFVSDARAHMPVP